jgi:hypothetical protein
MRPLLIIRFIDFLSSSEPFLQSPRSRGDIFEVHGLANSGRTHLVYWSLLRCLLLEDCSAASNKSAVVFDMDMGFDIQRLHIMIRSHVQNARAQRMDDGQAQDDSSNSPDAVADACLESLVVFRPASILHLATTIGNLISYMATHLSHKNFSLVAVDPLIGPSYWSERYSAEKVKSSNAPRKVTVSPVRQAMWALERLRTEHDVAVVYTCWSIGAPAQSPLYWQHIQGQHSAPVVVYPSSTPTVDYSSSPFQAEPPIPSMDVVSEVTHDLVNDDGLGGILSRSELCYSRSVSRAVRVMQTELDLDNLLLHRKASPERGTMTEMISIRHQPPLQSSRTSSDYTLHVTPVSLQASLSRPRNQFTT